MVSPIKTSVLITVVSLIISFRMYRNIPFLFPPRVLVISFSSSIIIVFCYCSIITNYESKTKIRKILMVTISALIVISNRESNRLRRVKNIGVSLNSSFFLVGMLFILVSIVCINKRVFRISKPLLQSY